MAAPASPFCPPPGVAAAGFKSLPAFCRVQATLTPSADSDIKVEVWLPATGWNGKFVGIGNGVWAGSISYFQLGDPLSRGYAVGATDTGHVGNGLTADFAVGHPEKLVDFGHRAVQWNKCSIGSGVTGRLEVPDSVVRDRRDLRCAPAPNRHRRADAPGAGGDAA